MKTKRKVALIFNILLVLLMIISTQLSVFAASSKSPLSLRFTLSADNGGQVVMADQNDVITVTLTMSRTDADEGYAINGFQNYIHYDLDFFELVEDSIVCYDSGSAVAKRQNSITFGEIVQCQNMAGSYEQEFVFCSFDLKIIGESGSGMIYNDEVYAFDTDYRYATVEKGQMQVLIDIGCTHSERTLVDAKTSSCEENGWSSHYACNDCDAVFDAAGTKMIPGVPYLDKVHSYGDDLAYNGLGHWYQCEECGSRSEYSSHNSGTATCVKKAVCGDCGQEYGDVNAQNHTGNTVLKNEKKATYFTKGYTGDVYCEDCGEFIESGSVIDTLTIEVWPVEVWIFLGVAVIAVIILIVRITEDD